VPERPGSPSLAAPEPCLTGPHLRDGVRVACSRAHASPSPRGALQEECAVLLATRGLDIYARNKYDQTPLSLSPTQAHTPTERMHASTNTHTHARTHAHTHTRTHTHTHAHTHTHTHTHTRTHTHTHTHKHMRTRARTGTTRRRSHFHLRH
jgi:hypothetical protein